MDSQLKQQGLQNLLDTEQTPQVNQQKSITFVDYQCHSLTTWMESSTSNSIPTLKWEKKFLPRLPAAILDQIDIKSVVQSLMFWEDDLPNSSILRNEVIEWKMYWENKKKGRRNRTQQTVMLFQTFACLRKPVILYRLLHVRLRDPKNETLPPKLEDRWMNDWPCTMLNINSDLKIDAYGTVQQIYFNA